MVETAEQDKTETRVQAVYETLHEGELSDVSRLVHEMHPAEVASLLEALPVEERGVVWDLIKTELGGEILTHVNENVRATLIRDMEPDEVIAATEHLDPDDLADIIPELPEETIQQLLTTMDEQNRQRLEAVLSYEEDTAGGLMNVDTITVRAGITLDVVLRYLRRLGAIPATTDSLMVVDRAGKYLGLLPITDLLTRDPRLSVAEVMNTEVEGIIADTPAKDVAKLFEYRDLVTAPVVNEEGQLLGRITIDDVVDVIRDEADHSFMSMAGLNEEEDMFAPVVTSTRRRSVWLGVNLLTAFLASWVIGLFDTTIEQLVALAVLMPIVASMGGIAGSQTLTLVIRGMALGQISHSNARKLLAKELTVGLLNGLVWALVIASVATVWFGNEQLGVIIGAAIVVNLLVAALSGATIPLLLRRLGIDPALAGSVVLTTVTDVIGFFVFLGLAALFLV